MRQRAGWDNDYLLKVLKGLKNIKIPFIMSPNFIIGRHSHEDSNCDSERSYSSGDRIGRSVDMIPWPVRRSAMGDVCISLPDGKSRVAEDVFGWNRNTAEPGMNEFRTKILCVNDLSHRRKPKAEEKKPELLADIAEITEPHSQSESRLRTTLLYTDMTAKAVYEALPVKGWSEEALPTPKWKNVCNDQKDFCYTPKTVL